MYFIKFFKTILFLGLADLFKAMPLVPSTGYKLYPESISIDLSFGWSSGLGEGDHNVKEDTVTNSLNLLQLMLTNSLAGFVSFVSECQSMF